MGYALFAQNKLVLDGLINSVQLQQTQRSDEQLRLATNTLSLQNQVSNIQYKKSQELNELNQKFRDEKDETKSDQIRKQIEDTELKYDKEEQQLQDKIYMVSVKENVIEMQVKRLDTKLTALQKRLEKIEEAEGKGIDGATPKFNGIG